VSRPQKVALAGLLFLAFFIGLATGYTWHVKASASHEEMNEVVGFEPDPCYDQEFVDKFATFYEKREQARILQRRIDRGELPHEEEIKEALN
jgi:hypothetical protein